MPGVVHLRDPFDTGLQHTLATGADQLPSISGSSGRPARLCLVNRIIVSSAGLVLKRGCPACCPLDNSNEYFPRSTVFLSVNIDAFFSQF